MGRDRGGKGDRGNERDGTGHGMGWGMERRKGRIKGGDRLQPPKLQFLAPPMSTALVVFKCQLGMEALNTTKLKQTRSTTN